MKPSKFMKPIAFVASLIGVVTSAFAERNVVIQNGHRVFGEDLVVRDGKVISLGVNTVVAQGPSLTEDRQIGQYDAVVIEGAIEYTYLVSDASSLRISAPANILPLIETSIRSGRLDIGVRGNVSLREPIRVMASGPALKEVRVAGSSYVRIDGGELPDMALVMDGSGTMVANGLVVNRLNAKINGSGQIKLEGKLGKLSGSINGSGDLDARQATARVVEANVAGSGKFIGSAVEESYSDLRGSGDIILYGNPPVRQENSRGSGKVAYK